MRMACEHYELNLHDSLVVAPPPICLYSIKHKENYSKAYSFLTSLRPKMGSGRRRPNIERWMRTIHPSPHNLEFIRKRARGGKGSKTNPTGETGYVTSLDEVPSLVQSRFTSVSCSWQVHCV